MICPNCKKQLPDDSSFCDACGAELQSLEPSEVSASDNGRKSAVRAIAIVAVVAIAAVAMVSIVVVPSLANRDEAQEASSMHETAAESTQEQPSAEDAALSSSAGGTDSQEKGQKKDDVEASAPSTSAPFWGVWIGASREEAQANEIARGATDKGLGAEVVRSDDWGELNSETWWCVTTGRYSDESQANAALSAAIGGGYTSAYVKYSGEFIGSSSETAAVSAPEQGALYDCEYFSLAMPTSWGEAWRMDESAIETREAMRKADGSPVANYLYTGAQEGAAVDGFYVAVYNFNIPSVPNNAQSFTSSKATAMYVVNESLSESEFEELCASFVAK